MAMMMMSASQQQQQQQGAASQLSSTYPPAPMEYVNMFSDDNVKLGKTPPPPPIITDGYMSFGKHIDQNDMLIRSLQSQGIPCLYASSSAAAASPAPATVPTDTNDEDGPSPTDTAAAASASPSSGALARKSTTTTTISPQPPLINTGNHKRELKKLNHSILVGYLDLLDILVKAPNTLVPREEGEDATSRTAAGSGMADDEAIAPPLATKTLREQKLDDIELLFVNMHHLINELRPYQARDNIRCILEMQKQQRIETATKFRAHIVKIIDLLGVCVSSVRSVADRLHAASSSEDADSNANANAANVEHLNELSELLAEATRLKHSLDKLSNNTNTNTNTHSIMSRSSGSGSGSGVTVVNMDTSDVEMTDLAADAGLTSATPAAAAVAATKPPVTNFNTINNTTSNNNLHNFANRNCDVKDLILCNLIDDYLKGDNEF